MNNPGDIATLGGVWLVMQVLLPWIFAALGGNP